jgi:S1-C subfamily serine protease
MNSKLTTVFLTVFLVFATGANAEPDSHMGARHTHADTYPEPFLPDSYKKILSNDLDPAESTTSPAFNTPTLRAQALTRSVVYIAAENEGERFASGSGTIIDNKQCLVITNDHVAGEAIKLKVSYVKGYTSNNEPVVGTSLATIVGVPDSQEDHDIAVLRLSRCDGALWSPLGNSEKVRYNDHAFTVGAPFGIKWTVNHGIVSHPNRHGVGGAAGWGLIQTDASINPGNSGGPLFNEAGEVVGMNTLIYSRSGENNGLGFAQPVGIIKLYLHNLRVYGHMIAPRFGVHVQAVPEALARIIGIAPPVGDEHYGYHGAFVAGFGEVSAGRDAGIREGDIILEFDGKRISDSNHLIREADKTARNVPVTVKVWRRGSMVELDVTLNDMSEEPETSPISEPYSGTMGWELAMDADKYLGVEMPVFLSAEEGSPASLTDVLSEPVITGEKTVSMLPSMPPPIVQMLNQQGITIPTVTSSTTAFTAIIGAWAHDMDRLELSKVHSNRRITALEKYLRKAHAENRTVVLEVTAYNHREIKGDSDKRPQIFIPEDDLEDIEFQGQTITGEELKEIFEKANKAVRDDKPQPPVTVWVDTFLDQL